MKTKFLALFLATLMLLGLAFSGCGEEKELTPEEYVDRMVDAALAQVNTEVKPAKLSIGVGNILPLIEMAGQDTSAIPAVEDIALDIYSGNTNAVIELSALINSQLCNAMLGYDVGEGNIAISSNLISETYGVNLEELMAMSGMDASSMVAFDMQLLTEKSVALVEPMYDSIVANSTLTKTEGNGEVTLHFAMDAEGIINMAIDVLELFASDADFAELLSNSMGEDISAVLDEIKASKDEVIAEGKEMGVELTMDMVIDKSTYIVTGADMVATVDGMNITMNMVSKDGNISFNMDIPEMAAIACTAVYDKDSLDLDLSVSAYGEDVLSAAVDADNGEAVIDINVATEDIDYETYELTTVETAVTVKADYTVENGVFNALLTSVGVNGMALDVSDMEITLTVEEGVTVPTVPTATKSILEMSEDELYALGQEFMMNLITKTGLYQ